MAKVLPIKALRYATPSSNPDVSWVHDLATLSDTDKRNREFGSANHVVSLYQAPNPEPLLQNWKRSGALVQDEVACFYVLEMRPTFLSVGVSERTPAHFLLCAIDSRELVLELEAGSNRRRNPFIEPTPTFVPDDQRVLRGLLLEAIPQSELVLQNTFKEHEIALYRLPQPAPVARRLRAALAEVTLRPHTPLPETGPVLLAIAPLSEAGLHTLPIHRAIRDLPTFQAERFLSIADDYARIYELDLPLHTPQGLQAARERLGTMSAGQHAMLLVLPGTSAKLLRLRQDLDLGHLRAAPKSPTLRSLDLALLNAVLLRTAMGIPNPEEPGHPQVFALDSLSELVESVNAGTFQAGFALNPPPMWEIRAVMEASQVLPPQTMRVSPQPPSGLLFIASDSIE